MSVPFGARAVTLPPRLSVNSLSSVGQPLRADLAMWRELGVDHVGLISPKLAAEGWDRSLGLVTGAGLRVSNISTEQHVIRESLELAASAGAGTVYVCSGPGGTRSWEESAAAFCAEMEPLAAVAKELGVRLALEPTNPLRADVSFVHSLRDALDLARDAGISVVVDLYSCWYERGFAQLIRRNVDTVALVQVCDYRFGTFNTPNRAVPGDGDMPLHRLLSALVDAGYGGAFDLEIMGPQIEAEGYPSAIRRSIDYLADLLGRLGA